MVPVHELSSPGKPIKTTGLWIAWGNCATRRSGTLELSEIQNADIEWRDDGTPGSRRFNDIYFSTQGGLAESEHVFITGNDLETRWRQHPRPGSPFTIVELGFGTGLNFLLCWQLLERLALADLRVHYLAFEKYPLSLKDMQRALALWPQLEPYSSSLLNAAIDHTAGIHRLLLTPKLTLDLYFGDALEGMSEMLDGCSTAVDCWFMDGFAPDRNPTLWSNSITGLMWRNSSHGATASTYSVAGRVRRNLQEAGFTVTRRPGYGRKRQMSVAIADKQPPLDSARETKQSTEPSLWRPAIATKESADKAIVIGAGLAGCSTAHSLVRKGWQVTLIDQAPEIAAGASGNPQGVLQPRLAAERSAQSRFYLHALLFAHRQFNQLQRSWDIGWHPGGILRIPEDERRGLHKILNNPADYYDPAVLTAVSKRRAGEEAGLELSGDALLVRYGGWLRPAALCQAYLDSCGADAKLITGQKVTALQQKDSQWQVVSGDRGLARAPVVVLCNSYLANRVQQTKFIPLRPVRGQLTLARRSPVGTGSTDEQELRKVVVAGKYICPADQGVHSVGASYEDQVTDVSVTDEEDRENVQGIYKAFASPEQFELAVFGSRASVRCNAADYFPVVGAVPDYDDFIAVLAPLKRNADARIKQQARFQSGLYINTAHGSYGLASCPLCAEYLSGLINGEYLPVKPAIAGALSPTRFIVRALKRQLPNVKEQD